MKQIFLLLLAGSGILCHAQTPAATSPAPEISSLFAGLDKIAIKELSPDKPGAVILVAKKGQIIYNKAIGMANMEAHFSLRTDDVFYIGSITKQFTAVAILQLMEQGRLSLQDDIGKYIPGYVARSFPITIEHLLTHTSGLPGLTEDPNKTAGASIQASGNEIQQTESNLHMLSPRAVQVANFYKDKPSLTSSGSKFEYNNDGYGLLGYIIEKVSGQTYGSYLQDHLFTPLGMQQTCYCPQEKPLDKRVIGYRNDGPQIVRDETHNMHAVYAAGAIQSTTGDLYKWNRALWQAIHSTNDSGTYKMAGNNSKLRVSPATLQKAMTPFVLRNGQLSRYGYGWFVQDIRGTKMVRHGGVMHGFIAEAAWLPEEDIYVSILSNSFVVDRPILLTRLMLAFLIGKPYRFEAVQLSSELINTYPGVYINGAGEWIIISAEHDQLYFQRPGGTRYPLKPSSTDNFFLDIDYLWIAFNRDSSARLTSLSFAKVEINPMSWKRSDHPVPKLLPVRLPDSTLLQYNGTYLTPSGDSIVVKRSGSSLAIKTTQGNTAMAYAVSDNVFAALKEQFEVSFIRNNEGAITTLLLDIQGLITTASKRH